MCGGFVMCGCVFVWFCKVWLCFCVCVCVCVCGFRNVWVVYVCVCVCVGFEMCGCFGNMCTCIYSLFVLFRLCIFIPICFVCTGVRTAATE